MTVLNCFNQGTDFKLQLPLPKNVVGKSGTSYKIGNCIGEGMIGGLYSCTDESTKQRYAIKIQRNLSPQINNSINHEYFILHKLKHPNILKLYDTGYIQTDSYILPFLITELLPHSFLKKQLELTIDQIKCYIKQICQALNYLHSLEITHGDIRPCNILLDITYNRVVLIDFGTAKIHTAKCKVDPLPLHFAISKDIYALGLCAQFVYLKTEHNTAQLVKHIKNHKLWNSFDKCVLKFILKSTHPIIKKRYKTVSDILEEIERWS